MKNFYVKGKTYKLDTNWQEDRQLRKKHRLYPEYLLVVKEDKDWKDTDVDFYDWAMMYEIDSDWN